MRNMTHKAYYPLRCDACGAAILLPHDALLEDEMVYEGDIKELVTRDCGVCTKWWFDDRGAQDADFPVTATLHLRNGHVVSKG